MTGTVFRLNGELGYYIDSVRVAESLGIDITSVEYEKWRLDLIEYSHKSNIYSYYPIEEKNPNNYEVRINVDWYRYYEIINIIGGLSDV